MSQHRNLKKWNSASTLMSDMFQLKEYNIFHKAIYLEWAINVLTGHYLVRFHHKIIGLVEKDICWFCLYVAEMAKIQCT